MLQVWCIDEENGESLDRLARISRNKTKLMQSSSFDLKHLFGWRKMRMRVSFADIRNTTHLSIFKGTRLTSGFDVLLSISTFSSVIADVNHIVIQRNIMFFCRNLDNFRNYILVKLLKNFSDHYQAYTHVLLWSVLFVKMWYNLYEIGSLKAFAYMTRCCFFQRFKKKFVYPPPMGLGRLTLPATVFVNNDRSSISRHVSGETWFWNTSVLEHNQTIFVYYLFENFCWLK